MFRGDLDKIRASLLTPGGAQRLEKTPEASFEAAWVLFERENNAAACGFLSRLAKKKKYKDELNARLYDRRLLYQGIKSDDPKMRKNAARLMGALQQERDASVLIEALKAETQRYARASIILSIGAVGGDEAISFLEGYEVAPAADETENKHVSEEREALRVALRHVRPVEQHKFAGFKRDIDVELRSPKMLGAQLAAELEELGITVKRRWGDGALVSTCDPTQLFDARCFHEMLIPLVRGIRADANVIAAHAKHTFEPLICETCEGEKPYRFRVELRGSFTDREKLVRDIVDKLESETLENSPSFYDAELRIEQQKDDRCDLYAKLYMIRDSRFDYRVRSLPASIHPATAAAVLRLAYDELKVGARVLDPFCGSGTMLIERSKLSPCSKLTGVDITPKALEAAKANIIAADADIELVCKDCIKFRAEAPYDEVITNMPFGNRVGSHINNTRLYSDFVDMLPKWLKDGGIAILYTMEYTLLKRTIAMHEELELVARGKTEAGGLIPGIFILRYNALPEQTEDEAPEDAE